MAEEIMRLTDMEGRLAGDADGTYRDSLCKSLGDQIQELKRELDTGLPPDEFERMSKLMSAMECAGTVVEKIWSLEHGQRR